MPRIFELFGKPVVINAEEDIQARRFAQCPFTANRCDGGGNRHQTKIKLGEHNPLRPYFEEEIKSVIPGICSIDYGDEVWIVCPRRLLGFKNDTGGIPIVNLSLQVHEKEILESAKLPKNVDIGIWPEVYLQYGDNESNSQVDYHFDFIAAPVIRNFKVSRLFQQYGVTDEKEQKEIIKSAKVKQNCSGQTEANLTLNVIPDLSHPTIFEIMTASTSGSNTEAGTDIASAFRLAIMGDDHKSPGINKRQVWGRMATQLFSKSALAENWGGQTFWVVQDQLLKNIERTTKLSVDTTSPSERENINFISLSYTTAAFRPAEIHVINIHRVRAGINFRENSSAVDILLPKDTPHKKELLKAMLRRDLAAVVNL